MRPSRVATLVACLFAFAAQAQQTAVYKIIPSTLPGSVYSFGFQTQQTLERGDRINLGPGPRNLRRVEIVFVTYACQTGNWSDGTCNTATSTPFYHPITLKIYSNVDTNEVLYQTTVNAALPYRPSANPVKCPKLTNGWYHAGSNTCFNGMAFKVVFETPEMRDVVLPSSFVYGITYNTRTSGYSPIGQPGPYDALNVAVSDGRIASVGQDPNGLDKLYWYTPDAHAYCNYDGTARYKEDFCWDPDGGSLIDVYTDSPPGALPLSPINLTATATSTSAISLAWTDNATDETGYKVERKTGSGGTWTQIATLSANAVSYNSTGLAANTTYFYRVRASNLNGDSAYSNETFATTPAPLTVPTAPLNVAASKSGSTVTVTWTDNSGNESGFDIGRAKRSSKGKYGSVSAIAAVGAGVITWSGSQSSGTYRYYVRSKNAAGTSAWAGPSAAIKF